MKNLLKKDKIFRLAYKKRFHFRLILKLINKNKLISTEIKWNSLHSISKKNKHYSISLLNHCCIYTGRLSSLNKKFKFSRLVLLKLSRLNLISDFKKTYW